MSFDILFLQPVGQSLTEKDFAVYFSRRRHYKVEGSQAWYSNENTGVYFCFDLGQDTPDPEDDDAPIPAIAQFTLNYFRPHTFALEAEYELTSFVRALGLPIHDPQLDGMSDGPYNPERFIEGWNRGNEFAYSSLLSQDGRSAASHVLPGQAIEQYWRWNMERIELQMRLSDDIFVPKISFAEYNGAVVSVAVWTDGIPSTLPDVDLFVVVRQELAPSEEDTVIVPAADVQPIVSQFPVKPGPRSYRLLEYDEPPDSIAKWIIKLPRTKTQFKWLNADSIHDQEIVEKYAGA